MSTFAAKENVGLDLTGKVAAIAGGTQGIGMATGLRFAEAGASVYVIGRDEARGASVVDELRKAGGMAEGKTFEFIKADLSLISGIKEVAAKLEAKAGTHGVDYLVCTQGKPPNGKFSINSEGHESHFAIQVLSRFSLAYLLAKSGTLKEAVVHVCAPNGSSGKAPDTEDLELIKAQEEGKFGFMKCGDRDGNVMDAITGEFNELYNSKGLTAYHVFPGIVATNAVSNAGMPYPIVLLSNLFMPIISRTIGNSPKSYADIPVYLAANPKSKPLDLQFSNERLKPLPAKWLTAEPLKRKLVWEKLAEMVEKN
ncbi:hypothetical protein P7C70_g5068, partial [Phenoliferia sp. Uapishka_3]